MKPWTLNKYGLHPALDPNGEHQIDGQRDIQIRRQTVKQTLMLLYSNKLSLVCFSILNRLFYKMLFYVVSHKIMHFGVFSNSRK